MYRNPSSVHSSYSAQKRNRFLRLILLILLTATIVLSALMIKATSDRTRYMTQLNQLINTEVNQALIQINSLSRTGGSSTTSVLAKARQHVYAVKTLTEQSLAFNGKAPLEVPLIEDLLATIDEFERRKQTGQATMETQTALTTSLTLLSEMAVTLLE